jgi:uncharacterized protein (UPF0548 family)
LEVSCLDSSFGSLRALRENILMFLLIRPDRNRIDEFLKQCESDKFSYPFVGATQEPAPPKGYDVDHNRQLLGYGRGTFGKGKSAIRNWKMFEIPGLELIHPDTPIETGRNVALLAYHLGFWSLNSCRIVYVIDEENRFGFAYGTLTEHAEMGEERFTVEFYPETDEVWYDVYAFSRPGHFLVKLGYPYGRYRQKRFAVGSKAAMLRYIRNE